jgi:hypothetical protein
MKTLQRYGQRVRLARLAKNWTAEQACLFCRPFLITPHQWRLWEAGEYDPPGDLAAFAAAQMGTTLGWLVFADGESPLFNRQLGPLE